MTQDNYTGQPALVSTQFRTGEFCWSKVLLHGCPWWQQL